MKTEKVLEVVLLSWITLCILCCIYVIITTLVLNIPDNRNYLGMIAINIVGDSFVLLGGIILVQAMISIIRRIIELIKGN